MRLYINLADNTDSNPKTGIKTPSYPDGIGKIKNIKSTIAIGTTANFHCFCIQYAPNAPKSAGIIFSKAGFRASDSKIGCNGTIANIPRNTINVVTIEAVATAIPAITSPSSV